MLNSIHLMGRLTAAPEIQRKGEYTVAKFSLAVPRDYKDKDGEELTDFFRVVAWNARALFCEKYLSKGSRVVLEGSLQSRSYIDKNGINRYVTEVVPTHIYFADSKPSASSGQNVPDEIAETPDAAPSLQSSPEYKELCDSLSDDDDYPF